MVGKSVTSSIVVLQDFTCDLSHPPGRPEPLSSDHQPCSDPLPHTACCGFSSYKQSGYNNQFLGLSIAIDEARQYKQHPNTHQCFSGLGGQWGSSSRRGLQEVLTFLIGRVSASHPGFVKTLSGPPLPSALSPEKE